MNETVLPRTRPFTDLFSPSGTAKTLLRGTAGSFLVKVAANGLLFVSQIVFARWLGVGGFGLYVLALAWLSVLLLIGRVGFDIATVRFVAAYNSRREWALLRGFLFAGRTTVAGCSLAVAALFAGGAAIWATGIAPGGRNALFFAAAATPVLALVQFEAAALRGLGYVVLGDVPHSVGHPAVLMAFFLAAVLWLGVPASAALATATYALAALVSLLCLWPMLRARLPDMVRRTPAAFEWREWLTTAPALMLTTGFSVALNQSTIIILGALGSTYDAGIYGAAARLSSTLQIITFSLITAIGPMIARMHATSAQAELQSAIDAGVRPVFMLCCAATAALVVLGKPVLGLFGAEFVAGYPALMILLVGQVCWAATVAAGSIVTMTGHQNAAAVILAGAAALNLSLCVLLIPAFGTVGAAVATTATMAATNVAMAVYARRATGLAGHLRIRRQDGRPAA